MLVMFHFCWQPDGFGTEEQHITGQVFDRRVGLFAVGGEGVDPLRFQGGPGFLQGVMDVQDGEVMVVESCAAEFGVVQVEPQRPDEMQLGAGHGGKTDGITGITGDLGGVKEDAEHPTSVMTCAGIPDRPCHNQMP